MQNMNIRKSQGGFTLIELVIVIVVLGILAAVAIPRYVDLTQEAEGATCEGIRGALASSAAILIADSDSTNGLGAPESEADILGATVQDGWSGSAGTNACSFDIDLDEDGTSECTVTLDTSLCA